MSIQWNKQYGMKDVVRFLNQEVDLTPVGDLLNTKVDINKCAQVAAVVAIFGVLPAFTYGTVLGNLDAQREALINEVAGLQAQVISATQASQVVYTVKTDKESYALGATTTITYTSATSTGIVKIVLHDSKGVVIKDLATAAPRLGVNTFSFVVPSSTQDLFTVRVTHIISNKTASSNKFEVMKSSVVKNPIVNLISTEAVVIKGTLPGESDKGNLKVTVSLVSPESDIYIRKNIGWNTSIGNTSKWRNWTESFVSETQSANDNRDSFFLKKGEVRKFTLNVIFVASKSGTADLVFRVVTWGTDPLATAADKNLNFDVNKFKTNSIIVEAATPGPTVTLNKVTATVLPGDALLSQSDIGVYRFRLNVSAGESDMYIASSSVNSLDGFRVANAGPELAGKLVISTFSKAHPKDTANYRFISRGTSRVFDIIVLAEPLRTGEFSVGGVRLYWGSTSDTLLKNYLDNLGHYLTSPKLPLSARGFFIEI